MRNKFESEVEENLYALGVPNSGQVAKLVAELAEDFYRPKIKALTTELIEVVTEYTKKEPFNE